MNRVFLYALLALGPVCQVPAVGVCRAGEATTRDVVETRGGLVVSVSQPASEAGRDVLQAGGNAVDAAIATALALAVTYPEAGNLGGGGFMLVHPGAGEEPVCIDYRETAPAAATRTMYGVDEGVHTHRAVGVPGTVRGLALAHERFGHLAWSQLFQPAVRLAAEGFTLDRATAESLNDILRESPDFEELQRAFAPPEQQERWREGDRLVQPELAGTLRQLADEGPAAFYEGRIADQIVAEMRRGEGLITHADLAGYQARLRAPIHGSYRGFDVYGPPPPSSGGICLVQMLNVLETFDLRQHDRWSAETLHLMIEAMRRAYRDRALYLGDSDFVDIPDRLTSKEYAKTLAAQIDRRRATPSEALAEGIEVRDEGPSTTHFVVADAEGMVVSNTYTLEQPYGARIVVRGAGFLLNNEMGDFNWFPGHTDRVGRIGTEPNTIEPGKRMLSSMTPTIVARDGRVVLATGSPGGRTIINTVLCVLLNALEYEMTPREMIDSARMHQAWFPDRVLIESRDDSVDDSVLDELRRRGHRVVVREGRQGDAHSIVLDPETGLRWGVPDRRISGYAAEESPVGIPAPGR